MKHATVQREGFTVPLIGVPPDAVLQECSLCHDEFPLREVELSGDQFMCAKCASEQSNDTRINPTTRRR